jgi:hypothetical protein
MKGLPVIFVIIAAIGIVAFGSFTLYGPAPEAEFLIRQSAINDEVIITITNELGNDDDLSISVEKGSVFGFEILYVSEPLVEGGEMMRITAQPGTCYIADIDITITETNEFLWLSNQSEPRITTQSVWICDPNLSEENRVVVEIPFPEIQISCTGILVKNPGTSAEITSTIWIDGQNVETLTIPGESQGIYPMDFTGNYQPHQAQIVWNTVGHPEIMGDTGLNDFGPCSFPTPTPAPTVVPTVVTPTLTSPSVTTPYP